MWCRYNSYANDKLKVSSWQMKSRSQWAHNNVHWYCYCVIETVPDFNVLSSKHTSSEGGWALASLSTVLYESQQSHFENRSACNSRIHRPPDGSAPRWLRQHGSRQLFLSTRRLTKLTHWKCHLHRRTSRLLFIMSRRKRRFQANIDARVKCTVNCAKSSAVIDTKITKYI